jgi:hypothetical protein
MPRAQKDTLVFEDSTKVKHYANHVSISFVSWTRKHEELVDFVID